MAALDPYFAKDTVVTPGPDRRGEAEMSHVCLLNRTVQGTDDYWKTTNLCIWIKLGVQDWEVWSEGKLEERQLLPPTNDGQEVEASWPRTLVEDRDQ